MSAGDGRPALSRRDDIVRRWRATGGRGRKLRGLLELLRPYRGRTLLMFAALIAGTAASLAPPPLAKLAIDDGIVPGDTRHARPRRRRVHRLGARLLGRDVRADLPRRLGRPARAAGPADPAVRAPAVALDRLLLAPPGRRDHLAADQRRAGARPARLRRDRDAVRLVADADRHRGDPRRARLAARAADVPRLPGARDRLGRVPDRQRRRLPRHAREGRADHRVPAGDAVGRARRADLRPGAPPRARLRGAQRREPRGEHEDGQPQRGVLPGGRAAVGARDRGDPALRRAAGDRGRRDGRRARRVHRGAEQLLRPDPAALAALHDLPGRAWRRSTRSSSCSTRSPTCATGRARSSCRGCAASCAFEDVSFAYSPDGEPALGGIDLHVPAGQTVALVGSTGAGKSTFAKLAARFYDPTEGRILVDGHDLRDVQARSLRAQMGIVPQEAFLFSGTIRDNLAFGRADATRRGDRGGGARGRRARLHRGARARLRHRGRRARDPALGRPAPARRVHARADLRPAHPRARRGDVERRHPHREPDRGGPAAAARRPHRDRDRAPALDDPPRRPHRRARPRPDRRAGHARRAARRPRAPTGACTATGPSRRRRPDRPPPPPPCRATCCRGAAPGSRRAR